MAASDNVLRGGLTPKHVDVPELLSVLDFTPLPVPHLAPFSVDGVDVFSPLADFALLHVEADSTVALPGEAIALCTAGSFTLGSYTLSRGESVYITDETSLTITGSGDLFIASRG